MAQPALYPEDRDQVREILDRMVAEGDRSGGPNTTTIARKLVLRLEESAREEKIFAQRAIQAFAIEGARQMIAKHLKDEKGTVRIAHNGKIISLPTRLGIAATDVEGVVKQFYQQPLWWEMTWEQFERKVADMQKQRDVLSGEVTALREIERLRERFPESLTPGEACRLAGIDPREFREIEGVS